MNCSGEGLISLDEAFVAYATAEPRKIQILPLIQAHQHYLAQDVVSDIALPLFTQSAVDGYALKSEDINAGITEFELVGEIRAGIEENIQIESGQCVRIFTGGRLPDSSDTVARQEIVSALGRQITLNQVIKKGTDIRYQGEELSVGTVLAHKGQYLKSGLLAALGMAGVKAVKVFNRPSIAVLITGDEVSENLDNDAKVFDANSPMILSWLHEKGFKNIHVEHVIDEETVLKKALVNALDHYDLVVTTGGVSVGDYDLIRPVSQGVGAKEVFWQVAQKPGKPIYFAEYKQQNHSSYLLGLPGNPAAVFVCLEIHFSTLLKAMQGLNEPKPEWQMALLNGSVKGDSREQLLRMKLDIDDKGQLSVSKLQKQQSHMLSNLSEANVIGRIPVFKNPEDSPQFIEFICL
jgi:molybdopterin molybdotransferase